MADLEQIKEWTETACKSVSTPNERRLALIAVMDAVLDACAEPDREKAVLEVLDAAKKAALGMQRREIN